MTTYADGYNQGTYDKWRNKPMNVPTAVNNIDEFVGYFHGYSGKPYTPPCKRQEILESNLKKFNFIT